MAVTVCESVVKAVTRNGELTVAPFAGAHIVTLGLTPLRVQVGARTPLPDRPTVFVATTVSPPVAVMVIEEVTVPVVVGVNVTAMLHLPPAGNCTPLHPLATNGAAGPA